LTVSASAMARAFSEDVGLKFRGGFFSMPRWQ